ncbi:hypothetical protein IW492_02500 [Enterococcus sp. BWB1-3]|uniref:hypothetical protein n=1 Tax=unclassified Enterococcus TaxID=2608891 RepID=UPI0019221ACC|nr:MULTISPECIES: hypothetical protein [unclassified Enterococcus]MBL1228101.1 hypothetical protein [Enterococcus sp. BWB1-3]MCB5951926.1 hypothetical protein [Enterococcus sp. BWT-B8]MCB5954122.1 hypothetical protein [Enterococcus sp. CWB-B31]
MLIQILIIAVALISIFIGIYIKKSSAVLSSLSQKDIPADFFQRYSQLFFILGGAGIVIALFNKFYFSLGYIVILLTVSAVFGLALSKKI